MKVTFLGNRGSVQLPDDLNSSLLISSATSSLLVDCSGNLPIAMDADIDDVVLTHEHIDHVYGVPSLIHQLWLTGRVKPLVFHTKGRTLEILEQMLSMFSLREKKGMFPIEIHEISEFKVGNMKVIPFDTDHTPSSFGLTVIEGDRKIVYTSDTRPWKEDDIRDFMRNPDMLITETSGVHEEESILVGKGHQSGIDAANLARMLNAEKLRILHLPADTEKAESILAETAGDFASTEIAKTRGVEEI